MNRPASIRITRRHLLAMLPFAAAASFDPAPSWPVLAALQGKVVLLDFWASWCAPCRRSFPWMNALQQRHRAAGLVVLAVNVDHERALADGFLQELPVSFRLEFDPAGDVASRFQVQAMPTSFLIDRRGRVRARHAGFRDAQREEREHELQLLLEETA